MSKKAAEQSVQVYCPRHDAHIEAFVAGRVVCVKDDEHVLAERFPAEAFWEYCCDCERFYPLELAREKREKDGLPADYCLACERDLIRHYVCAECNVISHKSREMERGRGLFSISATGLVRPSCPGCMTARPTSVLEHVCPRLFIGFTTARAACPFCKEPIAPEPYVAGLLTEGEGGAALTVVALAESETLPAVRVGVEHEGEASAVAVGEGAVQVPAVEAEPAGLHPLGKLKRFGRWVIVLYHNPKWLAAGGILGLFLTLLQLMVTGPIWRPVLRLFNDRPILKMIRVSPPKISSGGSVDLTAIAEDEDGDKLQYEWGSSTGKIDGNGAGVTLSFTESDGRTGDAPITVWLRIVDTDGADVRADVEVGIVKNNPPILNDLLAAKQPVVAGERVQLTALAYDPEGETLQYHWSPTAGAIEENGRPIAFLNTEGINVTSGDVKVGVNVTVRDQRGGIIPGRLDIIVQPRQTTAESNQRPFFLQRPPEDADVTAGESLGLEAYATDPDNDELEYVWKAQKGRIEGTGESVKLNTSNLNTGKSSVRSFVTLTVKDRRGASIASVVRVRVLPAEMPKVADPVPAPRPEPTPTSTAAPP
jgi:hypothetical protein